MRTVPAAAWLLCCVESPSCAQVEEKTVDMLGNSPEVSEGRPYVNTSLARGVGPQGGVEEVMRHTCITRPIWNGEAMMASGSESRRFKRK